jgi:bifunctional non-homologous end joining protein LigD
MHATRAAQPFDRAGWIFELKYDGRRVLACREGKKVRLLGGRGSDLARGFPEVVACLRTLPDGVLDGTLARARPARFFAFDLLALRGKDLRRLPLLERKEALRRLLKDAVHIRYTSHIAEQGKLLFEAAAKLEMAGIVAKRGDAPYARGRSPDWVEIKR